MFIDSYQRICKHFGVTPTSILEPLGISTGAYSNWKRGSEPTNPTKKKIADYFGITIDELEAGEIKKPGINKDVRLSDVEYEFMEMVRQLPYEQRRLVEQLVKMFYNNQE